MRTIAQFVIILFLMGTIGRLNAQSQIDYVTPILETDGVGNKIYAAKHDSEIVFVTNGLSHDSLITEWNGFKVRYVEKDSLHAYVLKCGSPRFVFEITKATVSPESLAVNYLVYTASRNGKQRNLFFTMLSSSSVMVARDRKP